MARPLAFVTHHLNPWGGHDRSTLEIARHLSTKMTVDAYAYGIEGTPWKPHHFFQIRPYFRRPAILLSSYFHVASLFYFNRPSSKKLRPLIHSTGTASLCADVIHVQFVNHAWRAQLQKTTGTTYQLPGSRGGNALKRFLRSAYQSSLLNFYCSLESCLYSPNKHYIAIANCVAEELKTHFAIPPDRIKIIRHGVDSTQFHPSLEDRKRLRQSLRIDETVPVILFVGEFERKGLAVTLKALSKLGQHTFQLVVVGNGPRDGFLAFAKELNIESRIHFVGHIKNVEEFYRMADIFVLPTLYEPFGLVILEAMASGLACVVSRCAGASELMTSGKNGQIINNPQDPQEVANLIEQLLIDTDLRKNMGQAARQTAEGRSWEVVAQEYEGFLRPLLEETHE